VQPANAPVRSDSGTSPEESDRVTERRSGVGAAGTILDLGANALGVLGNVLQDVSASQRSRDETATIGNSEAAPLSVLVGQALGVVQTFFEANERRNPDSATNPGPYQRRWRAKE
jgi:hypothetical protein